MKLMVYEGKLVIGLYDEYIKYKGMCMLSDDRVVHDTYGEWIVMYSVYQHCMMYDGRLVWDELVGSCIV